MGDAVPTGAAQETTGALGVLTRRLLSDVTRKSGIRHDTALERKLCRILASMPLGVLEEWVRTIEGAAADSADWLSLIENLTVHETYFFRDLPLIAHLRRSVLPALVRERLAAGTPVLRLWCAGCASGEEAYTLAILALDVLAAERQARRSAAGVETGWTLEVLGTDISRLAVRQARAAVYGGEGLTAFRDMPAEFASWFEPVEGAEAGYRRVRADARRHVRFAQHNLMAAEPPEQGCDLVSCRNVMIYFDEAGRAAAQAQLLRALRPGGVLVLGPTDRLTVPADVERLRGDRAIAYRLRSGP